MKFNIMEMKYNEAKQISSWVYQEPYSIYSNDGSESCIEELLNGQYFSVTDIENNLIGFYCFGEAAQVPAGRQSDVYHEKDVIDIGLGIRPDLCDQGIGFEFLSSGLEFAKSGLASKRFRLTVASFNKRAIKVYERIGFEKVSSFKRIAGIEEMEFEVMILSGTGK
jgi:[ribosomal protein S18]-alanine N-acetyltransferase